MVAIDCPQLGALGVTLGAPSDSAEKVTPNGADSDRGKLIAAIAERSGEKQTAIGITAGAKLAITEAEDGKPGRALDQGRNRLMSAKGLGLA